MARTCTAWGLPARPAPASSARQGAPGWRHAGATGCGRTSPRLGRNHAAGFVAGSLAQSKGCSPGGGAAGGGLKGGGLAGGGDPGGGLPGGGDPGGGLPGGGDPGGGLPGGGEALVPGGGLPAAGRHTSAKSWTSTSTLT